MTSPKDVSSKSADPTVEVTLTVKKVCGKPQTGMWVDWHREKITLPIVTIEVTEYEPTIYGWPDQCVFEHKEQLP